MRNKLVILSVVLLILYVFFSDDDDLNTMTKVNDLALSIINELMHWAKGVKK